MNNEELAKQWMGSPHWGGWRGGMTSTSGLICIRTSSFIDQSGNFYGSELLIPDLTHHGTLAFLLEDSRQAWGGEALVHTEPIGPADYRHWSGWVHSGGECLHFEGDTESESLMASLRAAPETK